VPPLFVISLKIGGTGLNLTAADTVTHKDPWWNPAVGDQATDRAHYIGQDKPVLVYKLVAQSTVDGRMLELQVSISIVARDRTVVRRGAIAEVEHDLVDVAPSPAFGRVVAFDDRMAGSVKVLAGVAVW